MRTSPRPRDERRCPKVGGLPASRAFQNSDRQLALQNVVVETDTDGDKRKQPEPPRRSGEAGADQGKRDLATGRADDRSHQYTDQALADDKARGDQYAPPTRTRREGLEIRRVGRGPPAQGAVDQPADKGWRS